MQQIGNFRNRRSGFFVVPDRLWRMRKRYANGPLPLVRFRAGQTALIGARLIRAGLFYALYDHFRSGLQHNTHYVAFFIFRAVPQVTRPSRLMRPAYSVSFVAV